MRPLKKFGFALGLLLLAMPAFGADLAILHNGFSIRHERRETLGPVTRLYLEAEKGGYVDIATDQIERFEKDQSPAVPPALAAVAAPPPKPQTLNEVINTISDRHHLDPDFISSVIHAESGFNPRAVSPKGAQGLMQLMPQTASKLGVSNAFDPRANVEGGTRYLSELLERYNFDVIKALAAYNAGPHRVEQYRGVPPYYETRAYVARIVRDYNRKKLAERKAAAATAKLNGNKKAAQPPAAVKQAAISNLASQASR
jgi:soluble lytic murein transglycosylase-like protein